MLDPHCRKCVYRSHTPALNSCDYISITGHRRGCPPGKNCTRRKDSQRKGSLLQSIAFYGSAEWTRDI